MRTAARIAESNALEALGVKRCGACAEVRHFSDFYAGKGVLGVRSACKTCHKKKSVEWTKSNIDVVRAAERNRYRTPDGRARREATQRRYNEKNPGAGAERARVARRAAGVPIRPKGSQTPIEVSRERAREWKRRNPEWQREYQRRVLSTPKGKVKNRTRVRVRESLRNGRLGGGTFKSLGYTADELRVHLERQFLRGMSWDNMSEWHIDHIIPLSSFNIESDESPDFRRAWCLSNLRPLWAADNMMKSDKRTTLL